MNTSTPEKRNTTGRRRVRKSKRKVKPTGYDTEQLRDQVGTAAKALADAQSRFTERVSRKAPKSRRRNLKEGPMKWVKKNLNSEEPNLGSEKNKKETEAVIAKRDAAMPRKVEQRKSQPKSVRAPEVISPEAEPTAKLDTKQASETKNLPPEVEGELSRPQTRSVEKSQPKSAGAQEVLSSKAEPTVEPKAKQESEAKNLPPEVASGLSGSQTEAIEKSQRKAQSKIGSDQFRGRKDIAQIVSASCVEAGFSPTGFPMRKFPRDYFELTGLKKHYVRYLEEQQKPKACDSQRELLDHKLNMVEVLKAEKDFSAGIVTGVPGCGKSTVLKKIQGQATDTILLYANPNLESCYKSLENSFYTQSALVADINHTFSTILIDEYTLCESAEILLLQRKFKSSRVFLFGDRCQGDIDSLISPEWLKIPRLFEGKRSYRFGQQTACLLKEFGLDIEGSDLEDKVVKSEYEGPVDETSQCLCFSEKTKSDLLECSVNCKLVGDTQGQQFERVTLFVAGWDQDYFKNSQLLLVGLTRHKTFLELKTSPEIDLRNLSVAEVRTHSYA